MEHAGERNKLLKNRKWCLKVCSALSKSWLFPHDPSLPALGSSNNKSLCQPKTLLLFISLCLLFFNLYFYPHISLTYFALSQARNRVKEQLLWLLLVFPKPFNLFLPPTKTKAVLCLSQGTSKICCQHCSRATPHRGFTLSPWSLLFPSGLLFSLKPQVLCEQVS